MGEKEEMVMEPISRRGFLKRSAVLSAALGATAIGGSLLTGCGPQAEEAPEDSAAPEAESSGEEEEYIVVGALLSIPYWEDPIAGMQ